MVLLFLQNHTGCTFTELWRKTLRFVAHEFFLPLRSFCLHKTRGNSIDEIAADADLDEEPDSHFKKLLGALERIEEMGVELDDDAVGLVGDARDQVNRAVDGLEERKRERDEENEDDTDWTYIVTQKKEEPSPPEPAVTKRSVFDDVDK